MQKTCFDHLDYREYLKKRLGAERGLRSKMAEMLHVQSAFVSRALHGDAHFSLEHGVVINRFLQHTESEGEYFLLLLQLGRAGSQELKEHLERQMEKIQAQRQLVAERLQIKAALNAEDQMTYYSAWYYSAIHVMLLVPEWRSAKSIAQHLQLPLERVQHVLEFLRRAGLAREEGGTYLSGAARIHLGKGSPILTRHHANWRQRATQAMDTYSKENLFYSGPVCLSEADAKKLREKIMRFLEDAEKIIAPSPEETVFCLDIDFFRV